MAKNIEINRETIDQILEVILENNKNASQSVFNEVFAQVRQLAIDFKQSAIQMSTYLEGYETALNEIRREWAELSAEFTTNKEKKANLPTEWKQYRANRKRVRERYLSAQVREQMASVYDKGFMLQEILNAFLNQQVETVVVWVGKAGIPETHILNKPPELYMDIDSKTGKSLMRYRTSVTSLRRDSQSLESQLTEAERKDANFDIDKLQNAYQRIKNRYDTYKVRGGGSYVLWLNPNKHPAWHGAFVSSFGSVNEAYAAAFLNRQFNPVDTPEDDIEILMNGVLSVTNLAGALEGDISLNGIEYAVKSKGASTLSLNQLLILADEIINKDFSQSGLQKFLEDVKQDQRAKAASINKAIEVNLETTVDADVTSYINNLKMKMTVHV